MYTVCVDKSLSLKYIPAAKKIMPQIFKFWCVFKLYIYIYIYIYIIDHGALGRHQGQDHPPSLGREARIRRDGGDFSACLRHLRPPPPPPPASAGTPANLVRGGGDDDGHGRLAALLFPAPRSGSRPREPGRHLPTGGLAAAAVPLRIYLAAAAAIAVIRVTFPTPIPPVAYALQVSGQCLPVLPVLSRLN